MIIDQKLRLRFRKVLSRHCSSNELEDATQEAMIHAWTMVSSGETDERKVFLKSVMKGRHVASPTESGKSLGKPRASSGGYTTARGRETKKRIMEYRESYRRKYGKFPTQKKISEETGLSANTITHHLLNQSNNVYSSEDVKQFSETSVDSFTEVLEYFTTSELNTENAILSHLNFVGLLSVLNEDERELLFLKHHEDLTLAQLASHTGKSVKTIHTRLKIAHTKVKEGLA